MSEVAGGTANNGSNNNNNGSINEATPLLSSKNGNNGNINKHDDDGSNHRRVPLSTTEIDARLREQSDRQQSNQLWPCSSSGSVRELWSRLTFQWFTPVLHRGNAAQHLDEDDLELVPLPVDCQTSTVCDRFDAYWQHELQHRPRNPSLIRALAAAFGREYAFAGALKLLHDVCVFVGPAVLHGIIVFLRRPGDPLWIGLGWTAAVTASQTVMSIALRHYFFQCYATGLRLRTSLTVAVYRKALRLAASERQTRTLGEITNLMSIDAQRLQDLTTYFHSVWSSPLQITLALFFLWRQLGASSLGGVSVILIMIPVTKAVASRMGALQKRLMAAKDRRVELNGEVLAGMKVIKFQAWEEPFQERIQQLRDTELGQLLRYYIGTSFSRMLWTFTPLAVALATFGVYVWTGHRLDVASALTSLTLFDILRFPLFMLPQVINNTVEAIVSLRRIRSFLLCDEHEPVSEGSLKDICGIRMRNVSAVYETQRAGAAGRMDAQTKKLAEQQWEVQLLKSQLEEAERKIRELTQKNQSTTTTAIDEEEATQAGNVVMMAHRDEEEEEDVNNNNKSVLCLRGVNFDCKPGEFVAIVGGVGCGKSSFINAILGEVRQLTGTTNVKGKLAYFSQIPFIMNATVRDNILFGHINEPVDEALYQRALQCCSLTHDLELLPNGDETEIGEKGITLSGGQKARIALARAVYHRADVTIIDDALSAVDAHVATELFEQALVQELLASNNVTGGATSTNDDNKKRSVVLVTNAIQYLNHPRVDRIVVLQEGRVVEQGSYKQLAAQKDSVFARFLSVLSETGVSGSLTEGCVPPDSPKKRSSFVSPDGKAVADTAVVAAPVAGGADPQKPSKKLMTEETRMKGHVDFAVYLSWFQAAGGVVVVPIAIVLAFAIGEGVQVLSNWWLTYWSAHGDSQSQRELLTVYAIINMSAALVGLFRMLLIAYFGLRASRQLFADMLKVVLHGKMSFFDTTPVGRLVNRFSRDIYVIDEQLTQTLRTYLMTLFSVFSTLVVVSFVTPIFALCLIPMCIFYINEQKFFTLTYRELKRLDSVNRSPIYALLGETVDGVAVVRAFSAQDSLRYRLVAMLDRQQHAYFLTCAAQSWLAVRLELIGTLIITFACLSAVLQHAAAGANEIFAGLAGLSISYSLSVTQSLNWSVRMASDMEANFVAVERVKEYTQIENEAARHLPIDDTLPVDWPPKGEIVFEQAQLRYRPELPLVLKGMDLRIPAGSKVGVVGRTGAGKSTLMVALMRIVELSGGRILIDGTDTSKVGLAKLRRNLAVIPQDPVLFSGTLRTNLDPFNDFRDEELYGTLEKVGLYSGQGIGGSSHSVNSLSNVRVDSLEDPVTEGGTNFSVGQRQLLVIGRALLRGARIVIIDEATASVDSETDAAIQLVMRKEFTDATCITVAHRINTILDSDYILVMDNGRAAEFDEPKNLLQKGGMFRDLVKAAAHD